MQPTHSVFRRVSPGTLTALPLLLIGGGFAALILPTWDAQPLSFQLLTVLLLLLGCWTLWLGLFRRKPGAAGLTALPIAALVCLVPVLIQRSGYLPVPMDESVLFLMLAAIAGTHVLISFRAVWMAAVALSVGVLPLLPAFLYEPYPYDPYSLNGIQFTLTLFGGLIWWVVADAVRTRSLDFRSRGLSCLPAVFLVGLLTVCVFSAAEIPEFPCFSLPFFWLILPPVLLCPMVRLCPPGVSRRPLAQTVLTASLLQPLTWIIAATDSWTQGLAVLAAGALIFGLGLLQHRRDLKAAGALWVPVFLFFSTFSSDCTARDAFEASGNVFAYGLGIAVLIGLVPALWQQMRARKTPPPMTAVRKYLLAALAGIEVLGLTAAVLITAVTDCRTVPMTFELAPYPCSGLRNGRLMIEPMLTLPADDPRLDGLFHWNSCMTDDAVPHAMLERAWGRLSHAKQPVVLVPARAAVPGSRLLQAPANTSDASFRPEDRVPVSAFLTQTDGTWTLSRIALRGSKNDSARSGEYRLELRASLWTALPALPAVSPSDTLSAPRLPDGTDRATADLAEDAHARGIPVEVRPLSRVCLRLTPGDICNPRNPNYARLAEQWKSLFGDLPGPVEGYSSARLTLTVTGPDLGKARYAGCAVNREQ